ncbi:MAG: chorismate mutase [Gemmatimonadota bacterium]
MSPLSEHDSASAGIAQIRADIGAIDREIVNLLARRVALARRVGEVKRAAGNPTLDPAREAAVLRGMVELAREQDLNTEDARDVFWAVIGMCRRAQTDQP